MVTSLDVRAVAGHHAMPAVLLLKRPMLHLIRGGLREGGGGGGGEGREFAIFSDGIF